MGGERRLLHSTGTVWSLPKAPGISSIIPKLTCDNKTRRGKQCGLRHIWNVSSINVHGIAEIPSSQDLHVGKVSTLEQKGQPISRQYKSQFRSCSIFQPIQNSLQDDQSSGLRAKQIRTSYYKTIPFQDERSSTITLYSIP